MNVAGHQLQLRILERGPAVIHQRDPAVQVAARFILRDIQNVVRAPGKIRRQIRRLDSLAPRAGILQRPQQRGPLVEIFRQFREANALIRNAGDDFIADLPDGRAVQGKKRGLHFVIFGRSAGDFRAHQRHFAADEFLQQLVRIEQVVFVILLDDAQLGGLGHRAKMHGRGIDGRGDIHEPQARFTGRQGELAHVPHQGKIRVVNGEGEIGLIRKRRGHGAVGGLRRSRAGGLRGSGAIKQWPGGQQRRQRHDEEKPRSSNNSHRVSPVKIEFRPSPLRTMPPGFLAR